MSLLKSETLYTVAEYLALERDSQERHEYLDGQIYAMAGESIQHGDISVNLVGELRAQLRGTPCRVWTKDAKVLSGPALKSARTMKGMFSYPDLVVVCGEPKFLDDRRDVLLNFVSKAASRTDPAKFLDDRRDVLLNPAVIIEVLSPSTESVDRGEKFWRYRQHLASLIGYVLVSQSKPLIEHYRRSSNDEWVMVTASGLESTLTIGPLDCVLRLSEVYDRVTFPEEPLETAAAQVE